MSVIHRGCLAFKFYSGCITDEERAEVTRSHAKGVISSAIATIMATAGAAGIGFMLPNSLMHPWLPDAFTLETFMNPEGAIRLACSAASGYWGYSKTAPTFWHHVYMVWNPEAECIEAFQRDVKMIFHDAIRFLVTLAALAVPCYLISRSVHRLVI